MNVSEFINLSAEASHSLEPAVRVVDWDEDSQFPALRRFFALKDEAHEIVAASRRVWEDTPFSLYALQSKSFFVVLLSDFIDECKSQLLTHRDIQPE